MLVHVLVARLLHGKSVAHRLTCRLDREAGVRVTFLVPLAVDGADGDAPMRRIDVSKLGDVVRIIAAVAGFARLIDDVDLLFEGAKFLNQQVGAHDLLVEEKIWVRPEILAGQSETQLQEVDHLGHVLELLQHGLDSWVILENSHGNALCDEVLLINLQILWLMLELLED